MLDGVGAGRGNPPGYPISSGFGGGFVLVLSIAVLVLVLDSIRFSAKVSVRWINRVSIDTIRFKFDFPIVFDSSVIASQTRSTS